MRWSLIAVLVAAFALVGAGCGGDDEAASDTDTIVATDTTATDDTTTDDTTTEETETDATETDVTDGLVSGECQELIAASAALGQAFAAGSSSDLDQSSELFSDFVDQVPEEIRADVQILADAYETYADEIQEIGIEPGETPSAEQIQALQQALASIDQQEVAAASSRIQAWADANCPGG